MDFKIFSFEIIWDLELGVCNLPLFMVLGHQKQLKLLQTVLDSGCLGHAWIFAGPDKIGKKTAALAWASKILGVNLKPDTANADFLFLALLIDPKTQKIAKEITVEQIRQMIAKTALAPAAGGRKIAIIDNAHLMNAEAQNCLLKTLEEPPKSSLIILIAENERRLLETVRSRAQIVKFNFLPESQMQDLRCQWQKENQSGIDEARAKEAVELSFGRPGRLVDFLQNQEQMEQWRVAAKEFSQILAAEMPEKFAYAKKITENENPQMALQDIIEIWQNHFRRLLLASLNDGDNPGARKIAAALKKIQTLDFELRATNAHPRLSIENFFIDL